MASARKSRDQTWPALPLESWVDTCQTLHLWTQVVGKIRTALTPWLNHSWHVVLYLSDRGLSTSAIPYETGVLTIEFDFIDHVLSVRTSDGAIRVVPLKPQSVAKFYAGVMSAVAELGIAIRLDEMPCEISGAIRFSEDELHASYDREFAYRFWRILLQVHRVFSEFRTGFLGKCSPVHFFWGSFDLAVTRFSGRPAPPHPGGIPHLPDAITREAYSQEVSSLVFWPGNAAAPTAIFYSYAYPEPAGFAEAKVQPAAAFYEPKLREFMLPYDAVRTAEKPDEVLLDFAQSTYDAASKLGQWDRDALREHKPSLHSTHVRP